LQHISGGRVAWNVVTSAGDRAALNFSQQHLNAHDLRYEIANEVVDVVKSLWNSWEPGAIVADKASGLFIDTTKVHPLDHKARVYSVMGPLNIERCRHGDPLLIQAGGSVPGQELSARTADIVFSVVSGDQAAAKAAYDGLKARTGKHGRAPEAVAIMPG